VITVTGPAGFTDHILDKEGFEYIKFEWKDERDKLLEKYDPKAYAKQVKAEAKDEKKSAKKMDKVRAETAEWVGQDAPSGYGDEVTLWYQGEHEYNPERLTASIYFKYNSTSAREHTPEVLEALENYDGELDVVWFHSVKGTAIDQKVQRFAQDYGITQPIAGYGEIEEDGDGEEEAKGKKEDPMAERKMSAVHAELKIAEDYDALAPDEYASRPLIVLTKGGKYIGIYNPNVLTKEFLDSVQ
jgi:hypothetical protein